MVDFRSMNSTKTRIVQAAKAVLIQHGSGGFSVRKVAAEAGIALGNVQYHYKTKNDLLNGLLSWYLAEYRHALLQAMDEAECGKKGLYSFIQMVLDEETGSDEVRLSQAIVSCAEEETFARAILAFYDEFYVLLADFLGRITGNPVDSVCVQIGASLLLTVINGYGVVSYQLGFNTEVMADELTTMLWNRMTMIEE